MTTDTCASYRAYHSQWAGAPYYYGDLIDAVGIRPPRIEDYLKRTCFRGGGEFFPITGQLMGSFSTIPASAYIARRAFYLFGKDTVAGVQFVKPERRLNKYSDEVDKMQRIYPGQSKGLRVSECFRGHEIPNYLQEKGTNWQKDLISDAYDIGVGGPLDDVRFNYWNRRKACMCPYIGPVRGLRLLQKTYITCNQRQPSCVTKDEGDSEDSSTGELKGTGGSSIMPIYAPPIVDGIPFPFLPGMGEGIYTLEGGSHCSLAAGGPLNRYVPEKVYACKNSDPRCKK